LRASESNPIQSGYTSNTQSHTFMRIED